MTRRKTAFERDLAEWMKDPEFAEAYRRARAALSRASGKKAWSTAVGNPALS